MRKFFIILLVLISVFSFSSAEDIVGCWYMDLDFSTMPNIGDFGDATRCIAILCLEDNGDVIYIELDFKGNKIELISSDVVGQWEKSGSDYYVGIINVGKEKAFIKDGMLYVCLFSSDVYFGLYKMDTFDIYHHLQLNN